MVWTDKQHHQLKMAFDSHQIEKSNYGIVEMECFHQVMNSDKFSEWIENGKKFVDDYAHKEFAKSIAHQFRKGIRRMVWCGGRYYEQETHGLLPKEFIREMKEADSDIYEIELFLDPMKEAE